jgi:hypothetical protein
MHRAFVQRMLVEYAIDLHFSEFHIANPATLVLYNEVDAGFGDISFALKLLKLMKRDLPNCELILVSTGVEKMQRIGRPEGVTIYSVEDFAKLEAHRRPTLVISAPGNFDHCRSGPEVLDALGVEADTPFVYLSQYGSLRYLRNDALKGRVGALEAFLEATMDKAAEARGVAPDLLGHRASTGDILRVEEGRKPEIIGNILDDLVSERADNPLRDFMADPLIGYRACGLDIGEVGILIDEDLAEAARTMSPEQRRAELAAIEQPFLRDHLRTLEGLRSDIGIYAGYSRTGYTNFLDYISLLETASSRDIEIIMPVPHTPAMLCERFVDEGLATRMKSRGVGKVMFLGFDEAAFVQTQPTPTTVELRIAEAGKTLRVVSFYPLPHRDMRRLLLAAEPPTITSGDQSFGDAISAGKVILYIEPVYCQGYHVDGVLALASKLTPAVDKVLRFGTKPVWSEDGYDEIVNILTAPGTPQEFLKFAHHVRDHYNANRPLIAALKRHLLTHADPAVRERVRAALSAGLATYSTADGFEVNFAE